MGARRLLALCALLPALATPGRAAQLAAPERRGKPPTPRRASGDDEATAVPEATTTAAPTFLSRDLTGNVTANETVNETANVTTLKKKSRRRRSPVTTTTAAATTAAPTTVAVTTVKPSTTTAAHTTKAATTTTVSPTMGNAVMTTAAPTSAVDFPRALAVSIWVYMSAADFGQLNASRPEAVRGLRGGLADHLGIDRVQVEIAETSPDILTGAGQRTLFSANATWLDDFSEFAGFPEPVFSTAAPPNAPALRGRAGRRGRGVEILDFLDEGPTNARPPAASQGPSADGLEDSESSLATRVYEDAKQGRMLSQGAMTVDYELFGFPQSVPAMQQKLEETRTDAGTAAELGEKIQSALASEGLSVSLMVFVRDVTVTATTTAPPTTTTTTTTEFFLTLMANYQQARAQKQLEAIASGAAVVFLGLGGLSGLVLSFYGGVRYRALWKSAPINPADRESTAWVDVADPRKGNSQAGAQTEEPSLLLQEENALQVMNQRLLAQIERAEAWREEQEARQRQAEMDWIAAKNRCDELAEENRALSEEMRSLRESTAGSPDLPATAGQSPEPPAAFPSGSILPGSPGAGNTAAASFLAASHKQAGLKRQLTKAFGHERAAMIRARSEAAAEMYFGDA